MRYTAVTLLYWPTWLIFRNLGHTYIGMLIGAAVVFVATSIMWRLQFGEWKFWR